MPNLAAILLVRVDLRVDRQQFRNHIKIPRFYELLVMSAAPKSPGRHGGRPSQMPEANLAVVPDDTEVVPPKSRRA